MYVYNIIMSLNKLKNSQLGLDIGLEIGCNNLVCNTMECGNMSMPTGANIEAHDINVANNLDVLGDAVLAGNNYSTPDLGQPNYSLHTDGNGACFWSPDDTGGAGITYNGVPPTVSGQLLKFSSVDGTTAEQSTYTETNIADNISDIGDLKTNKLNIDGTNSMTGNLDMGLNSILTNNINEKTLDNGVVVDGVILKDGLVDGVDVFQLETDYNLNIDQSVKTTASPTFNDLNLNGEVKMDSYTITDSASHLIFSKNSNSQFDMFEGITYLRQAYTDINSASIFFERANGNIATPTALTNGDYVGRTFYSAYNGTSYDPVAKIECQCTENQTPTNAGGSLLFSVVNVGETAFTQKLKIGEDLEIKNCKVSIGIAPNNYILPDTSAGAVSGDVLVYDQFTKNVSFKSPSGYILGLGGNMGASPKLAEVWGDANLATNNVLGYDNQFVVPVNSIIQYMSYNTQNGDATSQMELLINGAIDQTFLLAGGSGVHTFAPVSLVAGTKIAIRHTAVGTNIGSANFSVYMV